MTQRTRNCACVLLFCDVFSLPLKDRSALAIPSISLQETMPHVSTRMGDVPSPFTVWHNQNSYLQFERTQPHHQNYNGNTSDIHPHDPNTTNSKKNEMELFHLYMRNSTKQVPQTKIFGGSVTPNCSSPHRVRTTLFF